MNSFLFLFWSKWLVFAPLQLNSIQFNSKKKTDIMILCPDVCKYVYRIYFVYSAMDFWVICNSLLAIASIWLYRISFLVELILRIDSMWIRLMSLHASLNEKNWSNYIWREWREGFCVVWFIPKDPKCFENQPTEQKQKSKADRCACCFVTNISFSIRRD